MSETPQVPLLGWDAVFNRICTWVMLQNKETGETYTHYNTHLDHKGEESRAKSVSLIIEEVSTLETPLILTGDFNFFEKSDDYDKIVESDLLKDSMKHGTMNWFLMMNFKWFKPIDFCFVTPEKIIVNSYRVDYSYRIDGKPVSDHFPLIVDFRIN